MRHVIALWCLCLLCTLADAQLTGNVVDYKRVDCTNRPRLDVHGNDIRYSFTFATQQVQSSICVMVISTPIGMARVQELVTELDYSLLETDTALSTTETEILQQFNLSDADIASSTVPAALTFQTCTGSPCLSTQCYFPFQCMPCTGLCALSVQNWCATNSLCSMVSATCYKPCVKACVKYYSCTCPQSARSLTCPAVHTLRLEQPLLLDTPALASGAPDRADQLINWCFPTAQAPLVQVYIKNFQGHVLHCSKFVGVFG